jgi:Ras-related protein Rab-6A
MQAKKAPLLQSQSGGSSLLPRSKYKVVFLGNEGVGKTSIITRFYEDKFDPSYHVTIGIDFVSKALPINDRIVRLQLWDTAGQERFRSLIPSYIRESEVAIIVYDIASRKSFYSTDQWIQDVREERENNVVIMLVGNKTDMQDRRQVSVEEGAQKAKKLGVSFIETSAKEGYNIKAMFRKLAAGLPVHHEEDASGRTNLINIKLDDSLRLDEASDNAADQQGCAC